MENCKVCGKHLGFWQGRRFPLRWSCRSCYDKYLDYEDKMLSNTQQDWREKLNIKGEKND